jgi:hypothetical protein
MNARNAGVGFRLSENCDSKAAVVMFERAIG